MSKTSQANRSGVQMIQSEADGRLLQVRLWPIKDAKACVQLIHGIAEHSGRYEHVAAHLNSAGYAVFMHDHRSFGGSINPKSANGHDNAFSIYGHFADANGWEKAVADILQVQRDYAEPDMPCFLVAHSMGSFMAQTILQMPDQPYQGVALSGTKGPLTFKDKMSVYIAGFELWRKGARNASPLADKLMELEFNKPFKPAETPYDWICSDHKVVQAYAADPLCGGAFSTRLAKDMIVGLRAVFDVTKGGGYENTPSDLPVYLFAGASDPVSENAKGVRALADYVSDKGVRDVTLRIYEGMRHEVMNEIGRNQVLDDLNAWLEACM